MTTEKKNWDSRSSEWFARVASTPIHNLLMHSWGGELDELGIKVVETQLEVYHRLTSGAHQTVEQPNSLFDMVVKRIENLIAEDVDSAEAVTALEDPLFGRAMWTIHSLPYRMILGYRKRQNESLDSEVPEQADQWIIKNEAFLRDQNRLGEDANILKRLVNLEHLKHTPHSETVDRAIKLTRPTNLSGFTFLDKAKKPFIYVQPSIEAYQRSFNKLTFGQLAGLDWSNVFVAGGLALGSLLCVDRDDAVNTASQWKSSDIDLYIYGLDPEAANEKVKQIYKVYQANLPAGAPCIAVRNSRTITFISEWPRRRLQIVLKKVKNPAEVLLNFDLDICAIGYDGTQVYMLPRAARALETGINVFTMDMLEGHYLGDRRATQESRVFKYASKGYGIRILPSYVNSLKEIDIDTATAGLKEPSDDTEADRLSLEKKVEKATRYFERIFATYMDHTDNGQTLQSHYLERGGKPLLPLNGVPKFTHTLLDTRDQVTNEPVRRSCLTGFELFFRHVALWNAEQEGRLIIDESQWATSTYEELTWGISYDTSPQYAWDETFKVEDFLKNVEDIRIKEQSDTAQYLQDLVDDAVVANLAVQRLAAGTSIEEVLSSKGDITFMACVSRKFAAFANEQISLVLTEKGLPHEQPVVRLLNSTVLRENDAAQITIDRHVMWQQVDRRIDEIFEVLWSYFFSTITELHEHYVDQDLLFMRQISQRTIRTKPDNEYVGFAAWVARDPGQIAGYHYGGTGQGFWHDAFPDHYDY